MMIQCIPKNEASFIFTITLADIETLSGKSLDNLHRLV